VVECDAVFGIGDRDAGGEALHVHPLQQGWSGPLALHRDADGTAARRRAHADIADGADVVGEIVDADRARVAGADVDRQVLDEVLVGVVALALVRVVLAAAGR
jgi:hypothetical protein